MKKEKKEKRESVESSATEVKNANRVDYTIPVETSVPKIDTSR